MSIQIRKQTKAALLIVLSVCYCSSQNCIDEEKILGVEIENLASKNKNVKVEFNFSISEKLKADLLKTSLFSKDEKPIINKALQNDTLYNLCQESLNIKEKINDSFVQTETYSLVNYSRPIFVSKNKTYLFGEILYKHQHYSGVKGGASFFKVFEKENNVWTLKIRQTLEVY